LNTVIVSTVVLYGVKNCYMNLLRILASFRMLIVELLISFDYSSRKIFSVYFG